MWYEETQELLVDGDSGGLGRRYLEIQNPFLPSFCLTTPFSTCAMLSGLEHHALVPTWQERPPLGPAMGALFMHSQDPWPSLMGAPKVVNGQGRSDCRFLRLTSEPFLSMGP